MPAVTDHPAYPQPDDPSVFVWRYLSFDKFVAFLEQRSLYFATADTLGDPYEGATSHANRQLREEVYAEQISKHDGLSVEKLQAAHDQLGSTQYNFGRQWTFVNCWHMNASESEAMWRLYVPDGRGVALRTRYQNLADALPDHVDIGLIRYLDYNSEWMNEAYTTSRYMHKRNSFAHEQEVRAIFQDKPIEKIPGSDNWRTVHCPNPNGGRNIPIELEKSIEHIFVAPTAPAWFKNIVNMVTQRYEIAIPIEQSELAREPEF